jgi:mRNA interferase RelE/StbE
MKIYFSERFKTNYRLFSDNEKKIINNKLHIMSENPIHASLRTKKVQGTANIFEASINMGYRMTWQYHEDGILLRNIGEHDKTLKDP